MFQLRLPGNDCSIYPLVVSCCTEANAGFAFFLCRFCQCATAAEEAQLHSTVHN